MDLTRVRESWLWKSGIEFVAGVDEVGVGPLAGPVVAAAVILPREFDARSINDSKKMTEKARNAAAVLVREYAISFCIAAASEQEIDAINIYHATMLAMRRAVSGLSVAAQHALVDGRTVPELVIPQTKIVGGDAIEPAIAAASILAKVHRDALMMQLHAEYPMYGFNLHKGYPTPDHQDALRKFGPCAVHRMSYPAVLEWSGRFGETYDELKRELADMKTKNALDQWRKRLRTRSHELTETERKRLRAMAQRRFADAGFSRT
ncbi:MAG: ribonuclease HII [Myxococcales bacterium]|nr:ribonuclease HII [Myxococcales bacterium]